MASFENYNHHYASPLTHKSFSTIQTCYMLWSTNISLCLRRTWKCCGRKLVRVRIFCSRAQFLLEETRLKGTNQSWWRISLLCVLSRNLDKKDAEVLKDPVDLILVEIIFFCDTSGIEIFWVWIMVAEELHCLANRASARTNHFRFQIAKLQVWNLGSVFG